MKRKDVILAQKEESQREIRSIFEGCKVEKHRIERACRAVSDLVDVVFAIYPEEISNDKTEIVR